MKIHDCYFYQFQEFHEKQVQTKSTEITTDQSRSLKTTEDTAV